MHPCPSFSGREVQFLRGPKTCSDRTVLVELPGGERRLLPRAWTSLAEPDPYALLAAPPLLRVEALLELAAWVRCRQGASSPHQASEPPKGG
jgi:hypothetical protein